jgi:hypothetical protein
LILSIFEYESDQKYKNKYDIKKSVRIQYIFILAATAGLALLEYELREGEKVTAG